MPSRRKYLARLTNGLLILYILCSHLTAVSKEGMWIPATIKDRGKDMKRWGLQLPIDQLYNEKGTGLNNAVVLFGGGCTGEIISPQGLLLTNHHCGYGSVQRLSGPDKDYFANGFFAKNRNEEIPCPGLTVTFVRKMENVTGIVLEGINDTLADGVRDSMVNSRIAAIERDYKAASHMNASVKPYFEGNQYWVTISETYRDIRLVAFPPNGIGAFGGDVENWMWPRHTGDFSMFRVYAGADNKPADYSRDNKPYHTEQYFKISTAGYAEGDFTMVYGFPGYTQEYISSYELKQVYDITDPISIAARTRKLAIWTKHMELSRADFVKYTAKRGGVANGWKKWQGEVQGLKLNNVTGKKLAFEKTFQNWAKTNKTAPKYAAKILPQIGEAARAADQMIREDQYNKETVLGIELIQQGVAYENLLKCFRLHLADSSLADTVNKLVTGMAGFYKNYDTATDKDVFVSLMKFYFDKCADLMPEYYKKQYRFYNQDMSLWARGVYKSLMFTSIERLRVFAKNVKAADSTKILSDPAWQLYDAINTKRKEKILPKLKDYYSRIHYLDRLYMKAQMMMQKTKPFYPNANLTLRLSYGQVKGLDPDGPAKYSYQTTLGEAIALDDTTTDIFKVPKKLKELYRTKDYSRWGVNGSMPIAFLASNHTAGGNSGSPVLNARGELIGVNFDRPYEGTMSDYYFDPKRCRNISVDIRYVLFILDKFGDAGWLIEELNITASAMR